MDASEDPTIPDPKNSIWLELRLGESDWLFELEAGEERALVVGSHSTADVQIERDGIASTHFHFERNAKAVLVVPGYRAALRINALRASEPIELTEHTIIEFCDVALEAVVHDRRPVHRALVTPDGRGARSRQRNEGSAYFDGLPGEHDPTGVATLAVTVPRSSMSLRTSRLPDGLLDPGASGECDDDVPRLGPQGTLIIEASQLDVIDALGVSNSSSAPLPERDVARAPTAGIRRSPTAGPLATTRIDVPAPRRSSPPPPLPGPALPTLPSLNIAASPHRQGVPEPRVSAAYTTRSPAGSSMPPIIKPVSTGVVGSVSFLAVVGATAKRHPLWVVGVAGPACLVVSLALLGAARLVSGSQGGEVTHVAASPVVVNSSVAPTTAASVSTPAASGAAAPARAPSSGEPSRSIVSTISATRTEPSVRTPATRAPRKAPRPSPARQSIY